MNFWRSPPIRISIKGALLALWREQGDFYRLLPQLWDREPLDAENKGES